MNSEIEIGKVISYYRKEKGLSIRQLSKLANVNYSYMSKVERGVCKPNYKVLRKISIYIGVHYLYLLSFLDLAFLNTTDNLFIREYYQSLDINLLFKNELDLLCEKELYDKMINSLEDKFKKDNLNDDEKMKLLYTIDDIEYFVDVIVSKLELIKDIKLNLYKNRKIINNEKH